MASESEILKYIESVMKERGFFAVFDPLHLMLKYSISQGAASDYLNLWQQKRLKT